MNVENVVKPPQKPTQRKDFRSLSMEHPCSARPYISPSMKHPSTLTMNVPSVKGISVWFCTKYETRYLNTPPAKLPMPMSNMVFIMMVKAAIPAFNACIRYFIFYFSFAIYYLVSTIGVYLFCKGTVFYVFHALAGGRLPQKRGGRVKMVNYDTPPSLSYLMAVNVLMTASAGRGGAGSCLSAARLCCRWSRLPPPRLWARSGAGRRT